jgi:hypothetical protein
LETQVPTQDDRVEIVVQNEFGGVILSKDTSANGDRLRVQGLTTGAVAFLDPLELESIAAVSHEVLATIVSPEARS